jgi:hypothetical protein
MPLSEPFPTDPNAILDPAVRWYPGEELLIAEARGKLIPPLVEKVRKGVKAWREKGYAGASDTTRALLRWWFGEEHLVRQADGTMGPFRWYFAQREAVESAIWLYEVEQAREPYALMTKYDSSQALSRQMFPEDWARYVMKLVTGAGKEVVKTSVLPDEASRAKLSEHKSSKFTEQYADYLHLGYRDLQEGDQRIDRGGSRHDAGARPHQAQPVAALRGGPGRLRSFTRSLGGSPSSIRRAAAAISS